MVPRRGTGCSRCTLTSGPPGTEFQWACCVGHVWLASKIKLTDRLKYPPSSFYLAYCHAYYDSVLFCFNILLGSRQELEVSGYSVWDFPNMRMTIRTPQGGLRGWNPAAGWAASSGHCNGAPGFLRWSCGHASPPLLPRLLLPIWSFIKSPAGLSPVVIPDGLPSDG